MHGGNNYGGNHQRSVARSHAAIRQRQAQFKALRLPWYGGRTPGRAKVLARMSDALEAADKLIAIAEMPRDEAPALVPSNEHAVVLDSGSLAGLVLQRDTVLLVQSQLDALGAEIDVKLLRAGNEAARDLTKLAVRVAEGAFKAQQGNTLVALLDALKASQPGRDPEEG